MRAILILGFLVLILVGYSTSRPPDWLSFHPIRTSSDYLFLRQWVEQSEHYKESMEDMHLPWDIDELNVAYFDFNDDGVEEMVLSFIDISTYYCGTGGCVMYFFEKRDGQWQVFHDRSGFSILITHEKILGYRTFYDHKGYRFRWDGKQYQFDCPKKSQSAVPEAFPRHCSEL